MSSLDSTHTATLEIADQVRGDTAILPKATTLQVLAAGHFYVIQREVPALQQACALVGFGRLEGPGRHFCPART